MKIKYKSHDWLDSNTCTLVLQVDNEELYVEVWADNGNSTHSFYYEEDTEGFYPLEDYGPYSLEEIDKIEKFALNHFIKHLE